jgi:hypothetical protein
MAALSNSPRAVNLVRDLLKIIEKDMLVIAAGKRAGAKSLKSEFDNLKAKCDKDPSYYTAKTDHPIRKPIVLQPEAVPQHLSIAALEAINYGSVAIPQFKE